jgi:hypothetical protein
MGTYPDIAEKIRTTSQRPSDASNLATTYQEFIAPKWYDENVGKVSRNLLAPVLPVIDISHS